jgi:hypothetical protein
LVAVEAVAAIGMVIMAAIHLGGMLSGIFLTGFTQSRFIGLM